MVLTRFSVKSKLISILIGTALFCILVIGFQGLYMGKNALTERINAQLNSIRANKSDHISGYLEGLKKELLTMAVDQSVITATKEFTSAFNRLQKSVLSNAEMDKLTEFYKDKFIPRLDANVDGSPDINFLLPRQAATRYLQYQFIANNDFAIGKKGELDRAFDRSYYSGVHEHYHPSFRQKLQSFGYYDLFLIDFDSGNIVYTVNKETDFATSLRRGPYKTSLLARLYDQIRSSPNPGKAQLVDFEFYQPSYGAPAAFLGTTVFDEEHHPIGIIAIQIPVNKIDEVMAGNRNWEASGLGKTGEVILVGDDYKMRSSSRKFLERSDCPQDDRACRLGSTVLLQTVENDAVEAALEGKAGELLVPGYNSTKKTITSFAPLEVTGLHWAILAKMDQDEADTPIFSFEKGLLVAAVILSSLITFAAMWIAYRFTRPIDALMQGVRNLRRGETGEKVILNRNDEFGDLAEVFNQTANIIEKQQDSITRKEAENRELLLNILPPSVVEKVGDGKFQYAEKITNSTIMFSTLNGFTHYAESLDAEEAMSELNDLINQFDRAAEKNGVEKIQTVGDSYMAASGITISRLDHSKRCLHFARDMLEIVHHFNQERKINLGIRIGIHTGDAFAGIVGTRHFVFDVWGDTVNIASRIRFDAIPDSILVSDAVHERLGEQEGFQPFPDIKTAAHGCLKVWYWQPEWAVDEDADTVIIENPITHQQPGT